MRSSEKNVNIPIVSATDVTHNLSIFMCTSERFVLQMDRHVHRADAIKNEFINSPRASRA